MEVNSLGPINGGQPIRRVSQPAGQPQPQQSTPRLSVPADQLEISSAASSDAARIDPQSEFKSQRIAQIQQQIADGTYETDEKLNQAIDRLIPDLLDE